MKKWEDILKDRLEGYESVLPEGGFAEFLAFRDGKSAPKGRKVAPWIWGLTAAVAASLAAIFLLRQPVLPEEGIRIVQQHAAPVAAVVDSTDANVPEIDMPLTARYIEPVKAKNVEALKKVEASESETDEAGESRPIESNDNVSETPEDITTVTSPEQVGGHPSTVNPAPSIPSEPEVKSVRLKLSPAAGMVAAGGLLAVAVTPILGGTSSNTPSQVQQGPIFTHDISSKDEPTGACSHGFPIKAGLSARIPLHERWSITTGLEYALYQSSFKYTLSGDKKQRAHYLGIPLRLDWTVASNRWLDVYLGGGFLGDYCVGAALAGERIAKDGFSLSLIGAGGIQFNFTERLGLYLEPEISWLTLPGNPVLQTYRSDRPVNFSVTGGIRFNLGK